MTVGELIEKLKNIPKETTVHLSVNGQFINYPAPKLTYYDQSKVIINQHGWGQNKRKEDGPLISPL